MPAKIRIVNMYTKVLGTGGVVVNTTSKAANDWQRDLSPFHLGPCPLYNGHIAKVMENLWQFSKVYPHHVNQQGDPSDVYWTWAKQGWADDKPHRYPMGRGAKPLYSWWDGKKLGYIDARKQIYGPAYAKAVVQTEGWKTLQNLFRASPLIILRDYDGYDYSAAGMTLSQVLNNPRKKMGHAFILAMLLTNDSALKELAL